VSRDSQEKGKVIASKNDAGVAVIFGGGEPIAGACQSKKLDEMDMMTAVSARPALAPGHTHARLCSPYIDM
jgi:hypothetical protein